MSDTDPLPGPVVTAAWLSEHLDDVVVVDVRWYLDGRSGHEAHAAGHIPGAVFADLDMDLSDPPTGEGGRHPLPDPARFAAAMGRLGIGDTTPVVAYDDTGGVTAGRLWWMLTALGGPAAVLDGGIAAWEGELESGAATATPMTRRPRPWPSERVVTTPELRARLGSRSTVILDARSADRYRGEPHPVDARYGHVPGARSAPSTENLGVSGRLRDPTELADRYRTLGIDEAKEVVAYCGSGVSACLDLLALEVAGLGPGRLYVGSWSAWGGDPELPLETGPDSPGS